MEQIIFKWQKLRNSMQRFDKKKIEIADIGIPETPTPLELANVGNGDTPPP